VRLTCAAGSDLHRAVILMFRHRHYHDSTQNAKARNGLTRSIRAFIELSFRNNRICDDQINLAVEGILNHTFEALAVLRVDGADSLIGIYLDQLPIGPVGDIFCVIVNLAPASYPKLY